MTGWIPTKDALPNENDKVIFHVEYCCGSHRSSEVHAGYFLNDMFHDGYEEMSYTYIPRDEQVGGYALSSVDYWFRQPPLPEEDPILRAQSAMASEGIVIVPDDGYEVY